MDNDVHHDELVAEDRTATATTNGSREERLARLDQMQRDITAERERLNRPEPGAREQAESRDDGGQRRERLDSVREVDLPDLEAKVTESQREAWRLGYQAGLSDAQEGGKTTANPFHPLKQYTV
jgi:hypothetical protein